MNKIDFELNTWDDADFKRKLEVLHLLEAAFDDTRNSIPEEFWDLLDETKSFKLGSKIKFSVEVLER